MLEGSEAIAKAVDLARPNVVAAYPITPQTHIVENLEKYAKDSKQYSFVQADSEIAAASIILGASAVGARAYTATSSQGLLLMAETLYSLAGLRLPAVLTVANRAISGPINIWNDHSDAMAVRDSGWIMLFAQDAQEAIGLHIAAFSITEKTNIPVMVNVDGFLITHAIEGVKLPEKGKITKFLGEKRKADKENVLDTKDPLSIGTLFSPEHYGPYRREMAANLDASKETISAELVRYVKAANQPPLGLFQYYGSKSPEKILVALGSIVGTIREAVLQQKENRKIGIIAITSFRPFPYQEIFKLCQRAKKIIVLEKVASSGPFGPLGQDILAAGINAEKVKGVSVGLGGEDVSAKKINEIISSIKI